MSEILRQWLTSRFGIIIDYDLTSFEDLAQDGTVLARILYKYGVIKHKNYNQIVQTYDLKIIETNLSQLRLWLKLIGIDLTEKEIHGIANKEKFVAVRLFYQLYVILNSKSKIDYSLVKRDTIDLPSMTSFKDSKQYNACRTNEIAVSPVINEIKDILRWHKVKSAEFIHKSNKTRLECIQKLDYKIKEIEERKLKLEAKPNIKYDTLTLSCRCSRIRKKGQPIKKPDICVDVVSSGCIVNMQKAKDYINYIKRKCEKCLTIKKIHKQLNKMILLEFMNNIVDKEDIDFKEIIVSKLLKQSRFEKQILLKIINIRQQKHFMVENLKYENKKVIKKKENDFIDKLFQQDANLTFLEEKFITNKIRQFELHRRLWSEKLEKEQKIIYKLCFNIVENFANLAIKYSEYHKQYGHEATPSVWNEWSTLFRSEQPIFDYVQEINLVLNDDETMSQDLTLEVYRQNGLDICDFNDYLDHYGIWDLEDAIDFLSTNQYDINCGSNILGHIVHKLLLIKYPKPQQIQTPVFPPTDIRACLIGVTNSEVIKFLHNSFANKKILIVEPQNVVNYFIDIYLNEIKEDVETEMNKTKKKIKGKKDKPKHKKENKKKGLKKKDKNIDLTAKIDVASQAPKVFPCCKLKLSQNAELGKYAYETLNLGSQINENLMIQLLAQYLKDIAYVKGWVFINFPETINEAYLLEELYNGKVIPKIFKTAFEINTPEEENNYNRDEIFALPIDEFVEIRLSKLLPNPTPPEPDKYESFFTSFTFMNLKKTPFPSKTKTDDQSVLIDFYKKLEIANILDYDKVTFEMLRDLVELISKDVMLANKIYDELVQLALEAVAKKKIEEQKAAAKKGKKKKGEKASKTSRGSKATKATKASKSTRKSKESRDKSLVQLIPEPYIEPEIVEEPAKPGEELWQYITIPLPKELSRLLATIWQDIELIYTNDFKQLFFLKRLTQNQIIPYVNEIETNIQNFIERPDDKQEYVNDFQKIFNEITTDLHESDEFKAELHYRVHEFRNKLWDICDYKMKQCENERQKIIEGNWFTDHTTNVINIYVTAAQLELDKCVDTLQFLQDYYTSLVCQKPYEFKFTKQNLQKLEHNKHYENYVTSIRNAFLDIKQNCEKNDFIKFLNNTFQAARQFLNACKNTSNVSIKLIETKFGEKKGVVKKTIGRKTKRKNVDLTELDILINANINNLILEWQKATEGEILRTQFRLCLIHSRSKKNLSENLKYGEDLFHEIFNRIQERYNEEVESVDLICQIFSRAVEACEPIQSRLVLEGTKFKIENEKLLYPDTPIYYGKTKEFVMNYDFTISQLNKLVNIFIDLAPSGVMTQKLFTFILEDMLVISAKDSYISLLPYFWRYMQPEQVQEFIKEIYHNDDYIDWKDFIIWGLLVPYPSEIELLEIRHEFVRMDPDRLEYVNTQQFSTVHFWFEHEYKDPQDCLRILILKSLLCKMFKIAEDKINYTALLLYFCKDEEPLQGVIKALELAGGQLVCWNVSIGEKFIPVLRKQMAMEEQRKTEALQAASSAIESIYSRTCKECISTFSFLEVSDESVKTEHEQTYILEEEELVEEEVVDESIPTLSYFLKWTVLLKVMTAALPKESINICIGGKSLIENLKDIYCSLQNPEFDNRVFMHEFLNNDEFIDIINSTTKFLEIYPSEIVKSMIEICSCYQD